ncbi:hypothetical protein BDP27DRAFT_1371385 [Rhodocollybia butyracea]|uniref:Uncharacterized protein n=1 Tax=Rhodocollybia butyracea TaxID=206335 RepID=A0A9P5P9P9_9AGAR|nr:hypothetical protein BDP27DRAFT_1371385 [Rhodocollybia butyracea]
MCFRMLLYKDVSQGKKSWYSDPENDFREPRFSDNAAFFVAREILVMGLFEVVPKGQRKVMKQEGRIEDDGGGISKDWDVEGGANKAWRKEQGDWDRIFESVRVGSKCQVGAA